MNKSFWLYSAVIIFSLSKTCTGQVIDLTHKKEVSINFVFVKGGTFEMGDLWGMGFSTDEKPVHVVNVNSFWISDCEITNEMFADFLNEAGNPVENGSPWLDIKDSDCKILLRKGTFYPKIGYEKHPAVEVSWYGAKAFAEWLGCRLPKEAEWEYAARDGGKNILFPTGRNLTFNQANISGVAGDDIYKETAPVCSFPPNKLKIFDLAGNVWELCSDWYSVSYYFNSEYDNPAGPDSGGVKVIRGGSWKYSRWNCRTATRGMFRPDETRNDVGFRIVKDVKPEEPGY